MTLTDWHSLTIKELTAFTRWYQKQRKSNPEQFPRIVDAREWNERFTEFIYSRPDVMPFRYEER